MLHAVIIFIIDKILQAYHSYQSYGKYHVNSPWRINERRPTQTNKSGTRSKSDSFSRWLNQITSNSQVLHGYIHLLI